MHIVAYRIMYVAKPERVTKGFVAKRVLLPVQLHIKSVY